MGVEYRRRQIGKEATVRQRLTSTGQMDSCSDLYSFRRWNKSLCADALSYHLNVTGKSGEISSGVLLRVAECDGWRAVLFIWCRLVFHLCFH